MREIKFRIFDLNINEMIDTNVGIDKIHLYDFDGDTITEQEGLIIMQYTGLKDKHDKDLYFDDYIQVYFGEKAWHTICSIRDIHELHHLIQLLDEHGAAFKVIGNIHENSDLL